MEREPGAIRCGQPSLQGEGMPSRLRFGDVEIDLEAFELRRGGALVAIEPQVFELVSYLARNAGRLVTKDELIDSVWKGRIVSDAAVASRIKSARRAIGDDGEQQKWIKTVHGRGVRFAGEVVHDTGAAGPDPAVSEPAGRPA
ncbi:MAG TPA: transcriptional regulator, partial [Dongiaceae bacterium]|nr:transcriptional regulator [Dongiaceae bacterium]